MHFLLLVAASALCSVVAGHRPHTGLSSLKQGSGLADVEAVLLQPENHFAAFVKQHGKAYGDQEYARRLNIFQANAAFVASSGVTHEMELNSFADLTWEEFSSTHLGLKPAADGSFQLKQASANKIFSHENITIPASVDWVKKGAVSDVKNQLFCGSCWAFATTGAIEGVNFLYGNKMVSLSEQELVDCDTEVDQGCSGGLMDNAYEFVIKNGGLDTEADYTYDSVGGVCNTLRESRTIVSIDGYEDVPVNDERALKKAVAAQPVSVAICAPQSLQFYSGGIVGGESCTQLNHGVLAVGYGTSKDGTPYWTIKNSWGADWGDAGYFKLLADVPEKEGQAGICMAASYPTKSTPNPTRQPEVCGYFGWTSCPYGQECSCAWGILDLLCLSWGCQDVPSA